MTILTIYAFFRLAAGGVLVTFSTTSTSGIPPAVKLMVSKSLTFVATQADLGYMFQL